MADVQPFKPLTYNLERFTDLSDVIAPPYDVISPKQLGELKSRSPFNVTHLTLPDGENEARYEKAGELLREWIADRVLTERPEPAIYPYSQTFTHPLTGERVTRIGFLTALRLEPFSAGIVLPHERTLSGPRADRTKLMETTEANLEPIFGMYPDSRRMSSKRLQSHISSFSPIVEITDSGDVEHALWEAVDDDLIEGIRGDVRDVPVFIVDGHHRYETALEYRDKHVPDGAGADHPANFILIFLAPMSDPGMVILPTHRIVHSLESFEFNDFLARLDPHFEIETTTPSFEGFDLLSRSESVPSFLLMSGDRAVVATLKEGSGIGEKLGGDLPISLRDLDVSILHTFLFEHLLGMSRESQAAQENIRYVKSRDEAIAALSSPDTQLVIGMNPTRFEQVEQVARAGEVMPQKSTYFYPKLASGLTFRILNSER